MTAVERISNIGYMAFGKESAKGTAVIPSVYVPVYDENFKTDINADVDSPIIGNALARKDILMGMRKHQGEATLYAEPNTAGHLLNMLLVKGADSGADPYTHPFTLDPTSSPKSYTIDIQKGQVVMRFIGSEISEMALDFDKNKMVFKPKFSSLKSFIVRELASTPTGTNPYTVVLKTNYDPNPTAGLVVGDTMRILKADGSVLNFAIASIVDGTSITTTTDVTGAAAGAHLYIRAATPSYSLLAPFDWARTEFRFATAAADALTATHTPVEQGSNVNIMWKFANEEGEARSGSYDPAVLARTLGDVEVNLKQFFDTPEDMNRFLTRTAKALVIRCFSGTSHELRITINSLKFTEYPPELKTGDIIYAEAKGVPVWNTSDGQGFDVKVINGLATH